MVRRERRQFAPESVSGLCVAGRKANDTFIFTTSLCSSLVARPLPLPLRVGVGVGVIDVPEIQGLPF